jgi:hypothetical protein
MIGSMGCGQCGMLVEPANAFHPYLYCQLFSLGVMNPAGFLKAQHFIPDPEHWGDGAPEKQRQAALSRRVTTTVTSPEQSSS